MCRRIEGLSIQSGTFQSAPSRKLANPLGPTRFAWRGVSTSQLPFRARPANAGLASLPLLAFDARHAQTTRARGAAPARRVKGIQPSPQLQKSQS